MISYVAVLEQLLFTLYYSTPYSKQPHSMANRTLFTVVIRQSNPVSCLHANKTECNDVHIPAMLDFIKDNTNAKDQKLKTRFWDFSGI